MSVCMHRKKLKGNIQKIMFPEVDLWQCYHFSWACLGFVLLHCRFVGMYVCTCVNIYYLCKKSPLPSPHSFWPEPLKALSGISLEPPSLEPPLLSSLPPALDFAVPLSRSPLLQGSPPVNLIEMESPILETVSVHRKGNDHYYNKDKGGNEPSLYLVFRFIERFI